MFSSTWVRMVVLTRVSRPSKRPSASCSEAMKKSMLSDFQTSEV